MKGWDIKVVFNTHKNKIEEGFPAHKKSYLQTVKFFNVENGKKHQLKVRFTPETKVVFN